MVFRFFGDTLYIQPSFNLIYLPKSRTPKRDRKSKMHVNEVYWFLLCPINAQRDDKNNW